MSKFLNSLICELDLATDFAYAGWNSLQEAFYSKP